jgi:LmbE family N-acetylglucosaminyl deacetylase
LRRAIVVAHPDDEILWTAPEPGDTIFYCSTPSRDSIRATRCLQVCKLYDAVPIISPELDRYNGSGPAKPLKDIGTFLASLNDFDAVITHNEVGEYGHPQHKQISRWVKENYRGSLTLFGEGLARKQRTTLSEDDYQRRVAALKCYDDVWGKPPGPLWSDLVDRYLKGGIEALRTVWTARPI